MTDFVEEVGCRLVGEIEVVQVAVMTAPCVTDQFGNEIAGVIFALIFTNQDRWQARAYVKNAFGTTAITGAFPNSDDTALTTNVFLTDPRLFGIRLTKNW